MPRTKPYKTSIMQRYRARASAIIRIPPKDIYRIIPAVGCSYADFKFHFERLFTDGMTWGNHGAWELDHIIPCVLFNPDDVGAAREANHWSNLRPMWYEDKLSRREHEKREQIPDHYLLRNLSPRDTSLNCNKIPIPKKGVIDKTGTPKFQLLTASQKNGTRFREGNARFRRGARLYQKC